MPSSRSPWVDVFVLPRTDVMWTPFQRVLSWDYHDSFNIYGFILIGIINIYGLILTV